jgi:hypothetical protein
LAQKAREALQPTEPKLTVCLEMHAVRKAMPLTWCGRQKATLDTSQNIVFDDILLAKLQKGQRSRALVQGS